MVDLCPRRWPGRQPQTGPLCLPAGAAGSRGPASLCAPRCLGRASSGGHLQQALPLSVTHEDATVLGPARAGEVRRRSPTGTTAPPSTEILLTLLLADEANPLPVRREERPDCPLRSRELGGLRLIEAAGEQSWACPRRRPAACHRARWRRCSRSCWRRATPRPRPDRHRAARAADRPASPRATAPTGRDPARRRSAAAGRAPTQGAAPAPRLASAPASEIGAAVSNAPSSARRTSRDVARTRCFGSFRRHARIALSDAAGTGRQARPIRLVVA